MDTEGALNRVRKQLRRETIKQELSAEPEKNEKTFIVTDRAGGMIGVVSAQDPDQAAAKIFNQKFKRENEVTREKPLELRIRDLGAGKDYHFLAWTEIFESVNNSDKGREGNEGAKRLIVRKLTDKVS